MRKKKKKKDKKMFAGMERAKTYNFLRYLDKKAEEKRRSDVCSVVDRAPEATYSAVSGASKKFLFLALSFFCLCMFSFFSPACASPFAFYSTGKNSADMKKSRRKGRLYERKEK